MQDSLPSTAVLHLFLLTFVIPGILREPGVTEVGGILGLGQKNKGLKLEKCF